MKRFYPNLGIATDWQKIYFNESEALPGCVGSDTSYALVSQTSFRGETNGDVATCRLFSQAKTWTAYDFKKKNNKLLSPSVFERSTVVTDA